MCYYLNVHFRGHMVKANLITGDVALFCSVSSSGRFEASMRSCQIAFLECLSLNIKVQMFLRNVWKNAPIVTALQHCKTLDSNLQERRCENLTMHIHPQGMSSYKR